MVIVAYDVRGVIVCHFVPHHRTLTSQYYRDFLVRWVRRGIRDKRPNLVGSETIHHVNAKRNNRELCTAATPTLEI
ncbi:hypothetical protein TNIN_74871 [Trichonephila inaurata madagascariensis]|uniref:Uncharacterized protein n=1 Tax=Trichonephila inaurata madagascariensis TaxID=2747483 RepID=A0A8X6XV73_9ARAC|nr:hypothetical protein TNIN_74871 [Trichonephila inaurata madagascariensis]